MEIQWHGMSCFTIKGKNGTVLTDPYDRTHAGMKMPKIEADVCVANAEFEPHHATGSLSQDVRVFDWPGEFEAKNISVQAISAYDRPREKDTDKKDLAKPVLIFAMEIDGFKICHLSNLGHKLTPELIDAIGDVDILLVPVGGTGCLDAKKAHEVIEQLDPRVVVPMYYDDVEPFLKEVGLHAPAKEKVLKFQARANLPQEHMEFKILEPIVG